MRWSINHTSPWTSTWVVSPAKRAPCSSPNIRLGWAKMTARPPAPGWWKPDVNFKHPTYYSPRGEGVIPADDPKNPLGGYWIGLTGTDGQAVGKESYGIHGTNDPDSIGKQSSMGCIRMPNDDHPRRLRHAG